MMNAEELEIARRLVACKGWVWIPGMAADGRGRVCNTDDGVMELANVDGRYSGMWSVSECIPDLSDDLTRLGVLAVVRRAYRDDSIGIAKFGSEWAVTVAYTEIASGDARMAILRRGPTELAALLAALEAAP